MLPDEKRKLWDLRFGMLSEPLQIEVVVRISRCPPSMFMVWICYSGICFCGPFVRHRPRRQWDLSQQKLSPKEGAESTSAPSDFFRTIEPLKKVSLQGQAQVTKKGAGHGDAGGGVGKQQGRLD